MLFKKTPLGDFADVQGGYAYKSKDLQSEGFCPVVKIKNVRDGFLSLNDVTYVNDDLASQTTRFLCETGDVLISMTGSGPNAPDSMVGRVARVKESNLPALINQRVGKLVIREKSSISQNFLYYCLSSKSARNYLVSSSTGSANQANINADTIKSLHIPKISYKESVEIGEFLSKFDDKIELNQKMNQTLEEIAKAIFKSWFVDFDPVRAKAEGRPTGLPPEISDLFPDELMDSEIGEIPKGWSVLTLGEIVTPKKGKSITKKKVVEGSVPVVAGGLSPAYYHNTSNVKAPTITISASGANAGFARLYNEDIWASDCSYISEEQTPFVFLWYVFLKIHQEKIYHMQQGAAQPHIYPSDLMRLQLAYPESDKLWRHALDLIAPMFLRIGNADKESVVLSEFRDTLLPKLISGELRIPDAEKFLEEAGI